MTASQAPVNAWLRGLSAPVSVCSLGQGVPRGQHLLDLFSAEPRPGPAPAPPPALR